MLKSVLIFLLGTVSLVYCTPSVWSCPFINPMAPMGMMGPVGEEVIFGIIGITVIVGSLFVAGKLLMTPNYSKNPPNGRV
ncbi:hypothetical protein B9Z55_008907 [Caenorhabditis nigoni]|uniref:Dolichol phosphate-mannose biosynthesis regulatory protein n=1 Tax=Caenorhabditis nigoni TaxID=1611254 RepID=A0A2G5UPM7_9PELO|nr:hypothetical protein B9Z55_008907 [Caenorhabditis nigoni]